MGNDKMYGEFWLSYIRIPNSNSVVISVSYFPLKNEEMIKITDSLSSKFETFKSKDNDNYIKIAIINKKVDSNYTLYVKGKEYKPFK